MDSTSRRIVGYNLLLMLGTSILFRLPFWGQGVAFLVYMAPTLVVILLGVWNGIAALANKVPEKRRAHELGLLLVLLVLLIRIGP
jgi:hypothetical protein